MAIKGVIFDMDGVLVDNRDVHIEAFMIFAQRYGVQITQAQLMPLFGMGNEDIIPALIPADIVAKSGIEALGDEKEEIYREIYAKKIKPTKGLIAFIDNLERCDIKRAVGSSGQKSNVDFVLEKCGITDRFDAVINGDMVKNAKPAPDIFLLAAEKMGLEPSACLVVEDSFAGIQAANRAGMKVIAMATTFTAERLANESQNNLIVDDFTPLDCKTIRSL